MTLLLAEECISLNAKHSKFKPTSSLSIHTYEKLYSVAECPQGCAEKLRYCVRSRLRGEPRTCLRCTPLGRLESCSQMRSGAVRFDAFLENEEPKMRPECKPAAGALRLGDLEGVGAREPPRQKERASRGRNAAGPRRRLSSAGKKTSTRRRTASARPAGPRPAAPSPRASGAS